MKTKLLFSMLFIIATNLVFAQSNSINYKAVISEDENVLTNTSITLKFTILEDATTKYVETHIVTTDANGIAIANIGEGTEITGTFNDVIWSNNNHFLKTEVDTGSGFIDMGTTEFHAVPYAISGGSVRKLDDLSDASSGGKSVYVGQNSGRNSTGTYNSAFGYASLQSNTTGTYNVALGDFTLNANITGQKNTAIGDGAGYYSTGSGNIFIGQQAGYDYTGDNKLVIGKSRGSSLPIIEGDLSTNALSINGDLTVTGTINSEVTSKKIVLSPMKFVSTGGEIERNYAQIYSASTSGTKSFAAQIDLPIGAKIKGMGIKMRDNSATNLRIILYKTPLASGSNYNLGEIISSGASTSIKHFYTIVSTNNIIEEGYYYFIYVVNTDGTWPGDSSIYLRSAEITYEN